jgi:cytochrome c peroxidase
MHDGVFGTLEEVMHFYNTGALPRHPAVTDQMLDEDLRDTLGLSATEIAAIIAFMKSLTDPGISLDPTLLSVPDRVPSGLPPVFGVRSEQLSEELAPLSAHQSVSVR